MIRNTKSSIKLVKSSLDKKNSQVELIDTSVNKLGFLQSEELESSILKSSSYIYSSLSECDFDNPDASYNFFAVILDASYPYRT